MAQLHVAIIGAGPAGLAMCKTLMDEPGVQCVVFEKSDQIGGVWVYRENHEHTTTAMYKNLRTNIPVEITEYPGFPYPKDTPSYAHHDIILKYLQDYADHFKLREKIRFNSEVVMVKPLPANKESWHVRTKNVKSGVENTEVFGAVVVCNGLYSVPYIPEIPGMEDFPGVVMHSFHYNKPNNDAFQDKTVLVLGAGTSGIDICREISTVAKKVYLVHFGEHLSAPFPQNVQEVVGTLTRAYSDGSVEIGIDARRVKVDCVVLCTGYNYSFPFLAPECRIDVSQNNRVTSLYKHVFSTVYPSLAFVGICSHWPTFPHFTLQSQLIASILSGRKVLPSRAEMVEDEERDYQERVRDGVKPRYMHTLSLKRLKPYCDSIAQLAGVQPLPRFIYSLYEHNWHGYATTMFTYRDMDYRVVDDETFVIL